METAWLGRLAITVLVFALLAGGSPALAEDAPGTDVSAEQQAVPTEAPPPTEAPSPTDVPPPTAIPTDPPTAIPTDPPTAIPTDAPLPTEAPSEPAFTEVPDPSPTTTPTEEPTQTPTPTPVLTYALASQPECILAEGQPAAIASDGTLEYDCTSTLALAGQNMPPVDVHVTWNVVAAVDGGWNVQMLPPGSGEEPWTARDALAAFTFDQGNPVGTGDAPESFDRAIEIQYRLRVHRLACAVASQTIRLQHDVAVGGAGTVAGPTSAGTIEPLRLTPALEAIPIPELSILAAPEFGAFSATFEGLVDPNRTGVLTLAITGLDRACGEWIVSVVADPLADPNGKPLDGARLVASSVNDDALQDGRCDLTAGCTVAVLTGGGASTMTVALDVELGMPGFAPPGDFGTTFTADLHLAGTDQEPQS